MGRHRRRDERRRPGLHGSAVVSRATSDHLGKLLTYIAAYEADAAIWIVGEPRPEHVQAITMLNTRFREVDFFMVRLEVISIGEDGVKAPLSQSRRRTFASD